MALFLARPRRLAATGTATSTKRPRHAHRRRLISSIKPYDKNPRINDAAVDAVAASIKAFGFRQPIVVDEDGVIIVGHTRYKAAIKLGLQTVPVHVAKGLTPAQAKAYRLADNQTATLSNWNEELLPIELAELQALDFDMNLTGFSADELIRLLQSESNQGQTDPDDIPEPTSRGQKQATCGSWESTGCSAETAAGPRR
jgi:site-specific DNA-methyltransferase (adenine-specific)